MGEHEPLGFVLNNKNESVWKPKPFIKHGDSIVMSRTENKLFVEEGSRGQAM